MRFKQALGYHDSNVHTFYGLDEKIVVGLSEVAYGDTTVNVNITITNPRQTIIDEAIASIWRMPGEDGELLTFDIQQEMVLIVIEWNEYSPFHHHITCYEIYGGIVDIRIV